MPYKSDKIKIEGTKHDRRVKLLPEDKIEIKRLYDTGCYSQQAIADMYGVSRKLIYLICVVGEEENKKRQKIQNDKRKKKPTKTERNDTQREYRRYKNKLYKDGEIGNMENITK